jgi:hypothetical protein
MSGYEIEIATLEVQISLSYALNLFLSIILGGYRIRLSSLGQHSIVRLLSSYH